MSIQHDYYEGLCALAAAGQIAHDELTNLEEHTETCHECRSTLIDFRELASQVLPEYAAKSFPVVPPSGMTPRFIARARSEGIPVKYRDERRGRPRWVPSFGLVAEFVGAVLLVLLSSNFLLSRWRVAHRKNKPNGLPGEILDHNAVAAAELKSQLQTLQNQLDTTEVELATKEESLEIEHSQSQRLVARIAGLEQAGTELRQQLSARDAQIADLTAHRDQLTANLERFRAAKASQDLMLQADQAEVNDLRAKVSTLTDQIDEREQLSAAAEQAKDLIVARNLRIVDVHDNTNGNRPKPFGRIFYTEGKRLIFYAYDLGASNAKVTFWVWGEKSGTVEQAKHLGVLHADDKREGRWVITFDDPQVLAEINTVFVTAESPKKLPTKPSSTRLLEAFLDFAPNHP